MDYKLDPPEPDPLREVAFEEALEMPPSKRREYLEERNIDTSGMNEENILEWVYDYLYEGMTEQ